MQAGADIIFQSATFPKLAALVILGMLQSAFYFSLFIYFKCFQ